MAEGEMLDLGLHILNTGTVYVIVEDVLTLFLGGGGKVI